MNIKKHGQDSDPQYLAQKNCFPWGVDGVVWLDQAKDPLYGKNLESRLARAGTSPGGPCPGCTTSVASHSVLLHTSLPL